MKSQFSILCGVVLPVRLQEKFEIDHSWEWKGWTTFSVVSEKPTVAIAATIQHTSLVHNVYCISWLILMFNKLWKLPLNSSFCAVIADSNSRWPHGAKKKAYFCRHPPAARPGSFLPAGGSSAPDQWRSPRFGWGDRGGWAGTDGRASANDGRCTCSCCDAGQPAEAACPGEHNRNTVQNCPTSACREGRAKVKTTAMQKTVLRRPL